MLTYMYTHTDRHTCTYKGIIQEHKQVPAIGTASLDTYTTYTGVWCARNISVLKSTCKRGELVRNTD